VGSTELGARAGQPGTPSSSARVILQLSLRFFPCASAPLRELSFSVFFPGASAPLRELSFSVFFPGASAPLRELSFSVFFLCASARVIIVQLSPKFFLPQRRSGAEDYSSRAPTGRIDSTIPAWPTLVLVLVLVLVLLRMFFVPGSPACSACAQALRAGGSWFLVLFDSRPATYIHHPPSTIHHPPSTIHHPPSTIHYPPSTIHDSLPTSHFPLPTSHFPLTGRMPALQSV
jgi:hypothetical protein